MITQIKREQKEQGLFMKKEVSGWKIYKRKTYGKK